MTEYVIAHATRKLDKSDPRYPRQTVESLAELPDPKGWPATGAATWLTQRRIQLPGFSGGYVWSSLADAERFPTMAAARARARKVGPHAIVVDVDTATEYRRQVHLTRTRAKARRIR